MNKSIFRPLVLASGLLLTSSFLFAQDDLVNSLKNNHSANSTSGFKFTDVINLENTSVKNQGSSGTCWSYSTNSFLESEMIRMGKEPVALSQIFSARNAYVEKGRNYVRMHGAVSLGDGGALHDVINMYRKYGAIPQVNYTGLNYGTTINKFGEMGAITTGILEAVVKNPNKTLTPNWEKAYTAAIDAYLGQVPEKFDYKGKSYTPQTFAKQVVGINPDDYVELSSFNDHPYYTKFTLLVPDNWSFDQVYNVKVNDITDIIDNALKKGYSVAWATDVSEKSFSYKNGVAYVPAKPYDEMTAQEKETMFNGPKPEMEITEANRQEAFDNYQTTDDHGMHIVGLAKDQDGKEYYIVKNSWGVTNDYKGYLYVTKNYVKYKTTAFLLNKGGIPAATRKSLGI
ncbi:aminopeptidase C [Pedobacter cryoconitis]|uniref:Aminopeptidase n=1 Tax=Pedobacter cryoconitis TaxID=188932 RepID=A0A7X0J5R6_9SPHI|nr:C1 family peptidase [Pedobacter cryoconitis]MBB6501629.1 bleomycin hydrolase [Pedobacter cryoconitis]